MTGKYFSYLSPKLESRPRPATGTCGVFACKPVAKGEVVALWGGKIVSVDELDLTMPNFTQQVLQIEEDFFMMSVAMEPSDCFNHSCEPNLGMTGQIGLIAMRDIPAGEEVCLDYAMCDGSSYDEFDCFCGAPSCRGRVTGQDWRLPALWDRYEGYYSPYLERRIAALKREIREERRKAPIG